MNEQRSEYTAVQVLEPQPGRLDRPQPGRLDRPQPAEAPLVLRPVLQVADFLERRKLIVRMLREVMQEGTDYGTLPGTPKPMLFKPGAEKLLGLFGLTLAEPELLEKVEDWSGADHEGEPFFYFSYRMTVLHGARQVASSIGLCHSREERYRRRWVPAHEVPRGLDPAEVPTRIGRAVEWRFAIEKAETTGPYAKPQEHWDAFKAAIAEGTAKFFDKEMGQKGKRAAVEIDLTKYCIPNPDVADLVHTISSMAQKRAIVAAVRWATNASDIFALGETVEAGEEGAPGLSSEVDERDKAQQRKRQDRSQYGTKAPPKAGQADEEDLYGNNQKARTKKLDPVSAICKAFGESAPADRERPPTDDGLALRERLAGLGLDADELARKVFQRAFTGLSAAHVAALELATDEDLRAIGGGEGN